VDGVVVAGAASAVVSGLRHGLHGLRCIAWYDDLMLVAPVTQPLFVPHVELLYEDVLLIAHIPFEGPAADVRQLRSPLALQNVTCAQISSARLGVMGAKVDCCRATRGSRHPLPALSTRIAFISTPLAPTTSFHWSTQAKCTPVSCRLSRLTSSTLLPPV